MEEKNLSKSYEEFYEKVSIIPQQTDEEEINFFSKLIISNGNKNLKIKILDLGCAEGKLCVQLALKGYEVTAADISLSYLDQAIKLAQENSVGINFFKCNIEEDISEFSGKKFDVIFFMDVIEHLKNPIAGLENIRMLLNDNGILYIHTPNVCTPRNFLYYIINRKKLINYYDSTNLGDLHFQTYDYATLEKTLNFVGLKVSEIIPTKIRIPFSKRFKFIRSYSKFLSKLFPFLSDTLLLKCKKERPINIEKQILFWDKTLN